jgi:diguanylate cyclase (GGDEF)-like protein
VTLQVDAPVQRRETSSATTRLVLAWVEEHGGPDAVARVWADADVRESPEQLREPARWTSYDTRIRLFEAVAREFGDPRALFSIGSAVVTQSVTPSLLLLLRALGSPAQVYRRAARAVPTFSSTSTMRVLEVGRASARIDYRLHDGYPHSRLDCLYAQGLLCSIPTLFGLPQAQVVHDQCESDGAEACLYTLSWPRWSRRARRREQSLGEDLLRRQVAALQSAATDLVSSRGVDEALERTVERIASTVVAQGYLLVVTPRDDEPPLVHSRGVADDVRARLVADVLGGAPLDPSAVVARVVSPRRDYGCLVALPAPADGAQHDAELPGRGLLEAYAGHAAAALDLVVALEDSRREEGRAQALLALSHRLVGATDAVQIASDVATALPGVVGSRQASALLWDAASGLLSTAASVGLPPEQTELLASVALRPEDLPELVDVLTERRPLVVRTGQAQPALAGLLGALDVELLLAVPLVAGDDVYGVVTVSWDAAGAPAGPVDDLVARLRGVADQTATALQAARLVSTVRHQALHDALTRLPNRVLFGQRLEEALRAAGPGAGVGVLFCDLDRFKQVNDRLGHAGGDELLRQIAARLAAAVGPQACVGRLSGDEFAVLLPVLPGPDAAQNAAVDVVGCFETPFRLEGHELRVTSSVGVASTDDPDCRADDLLRAADGAMYDAKQRGRNQIAVARDGQAPVSGQAPGLQAELRTAVEQDQLRLVYQPVVRLPDRQVVAVEALVRWQHPRLGLLAPAAFLPVAEECGLVRDVDLWAVREACRTLASWPGDAPARVAVNLSSATLADDRLTGAVRAALADAGLPPERLELEVVESRALVDVPGVVGRLTSLRGLGVRIALDDFGTGFSTLSWLHQLPADRLKVDRSFLADVATDPTSRALLRGVLALARALDLDVVAEGVETQEQLAVLLDEGCGLVQGYLLGRPAPAPHR